MAGASNFTIKDEKVLYICEIREVALSFGAHARVHTMRIVASGYLRGIAKHVPTTEAAAV